jgi:hypothetical protein
MPGPRSVMLMTLAIAALVGGCGHSERVGADRTLEVAVTEYRLNPRAATASAGSLTIVVHNYGRLSHNLVVAQNGQTAGSTKPIPPGQTGVIVLSVTKGTYTMSSTILSDSALGADGTIKVS